MTEFVPRTLESKGKSIDEAIFRGLQTMGVSIDEVEIETLQEGTKGLLGIGSKPFIIKLTTKPPQTAESIETEKKSPRREAGPQREARPERQQREARPERPQREARPERPQREARPERVRAAVVVDEPDAAQPKRQKPQRRSNEVQRAIPEDTTVYTPYVAGETECPGAEFLQGVLKRMEVPGGIGFADTENALKFKIDSDTMGVLIGHRGETLDALQYLTGLVVNRDRSDYRRVVLDTENYRNKREDTLVRLARKLAAQVRSTGRPVALEPMNPYERRVLHFTLQNSPYVTTHSEGEDPDRRVIIEPKK